MYWIYPVLSFVICLAMFWLGVYMGRRQERASMARMFEIDQPVVLSAPPQEFADNLTQDADPESEGAIVTQVDYKRRRDLEG